MQKRNRLYTVNKWNKQGLSKELRRGLLSELGVGSSELGLLGLYVDRENNNIFDGTGNSTLNTPTSPQGKPSSWLSTNGLGVLGQLDYSSSLSTTVKSPLSQLGSLGQLPSGIQLGGSFDPSMISTILQGAQTLGNFISGGKTSKAGTLFKGLGDPITGSVIDALFGSKINNENVSRFNKENTQQMTAGVEASSNEAVLNAFRNFQLLQNVSRKDVGSDGLFSDKAKNLTAQINKQRQMANAHKMDTLVQSVSDLDSNKDDELFETYAAYGGRLPVGSKKLYRKLPNVFAAGGLPSVNWKGTVFGNFANKGNTSWEGAGNAGSYVSAALSAANTLSHWKDEDYNRATLGSNAGMLGQGYAMFNSLMQGDRLKQRQALGRKIGLAYGGNIFATGGDYALTAASALKLYNNALTLTKAPDISDYNKQLSENSNWNYSNVKTSDDLVKNWQNNYKYYDGNISGQDLRGKSWGDELLDAGGAGIEGASAGYSIGGGIGAIVGGVVGLGSSLIGSAIGRKKSEKKAEELRKNIQAANVRQVNTIVRGADSLDKDTAIRAKAAEYAEGGNLNTLNMKISGDNYIESNPFTLYNTRGIGKVGGVGNVNRKGTFFDDGGMMSSTFLTHGANWDTKVRNINTGDSHENNPNDGVQVGVDPEGTPNLVEEGEVIWNDYVFSNRIECPDDVKKKVGIKGKQELTFADAAKKLEEEGKERPNDPISKAGIDDNMSTLAEALEAVKRSEELSGRSEQLSVNSDELLDRSDELLDSSDLEGLLDPLMMAEGGNLYSGKGESTLQMYNMDDLYKLEYLLSKRPANTADNLYAIDTLRPTYEGAPSIEDIEKSAAYRAFTDYILNKATDAERLKYFQWIDDKTGNKTGKYIDPKTKKLVSNWKEKYVGADGKSGARYDLKWGVQHLVPELIQVEQPKTKSGAVYHVVEGDDDFLPSNEKDWVGVGKEVRRVVNPDGDTIIYHEPAQGDQKALATETGSTGTDNAGTRVPKYVKGAWMQKVGALTPLVALGMLAAGVGKPNTSGLDAAVSMSKTAPIRARQRYIGDYLRYNPMDINYGVLLNLALSRATARAIQNNAGTRGAAMAGLLANEYNSQLANGELYRKALEYNDALKLQIANFNRGTNQFNAQVFNNAELQYANDYNNLRKFAAQLAYQAAKDKMDAKTAWYSSIYGNLGQLGASIGRLGEQAANHNWLADIWAQNPRGVDTDGYYTGKYVTNGTKARKASYGGRLKKRKK